MYEKQKDALDALIILSGEVLVEKNLQTDLLNGAPLAECPKSLDRKIGRMIQHERRKPYSEAFALMKQAAAAFLVVCTLMFAMAMSVEAVREAFWNAVIEWFDKYISVVYETETDPPDVIEEYREPQLIPISAEPMVMQKNEFCYTIDYCINGNTLLTYRQTVFNDDKHLYDNNVDNNLEIYINDNRGYITVNENGRCSLCWTDTKYLYEILFDDRILSIPIIISIAESSE